MDEWADNIYYELGVDSCLCNPCVFMCVAYHNMYCIRVFAYFLVGAPKALLGALSTFVIVIIIALVISQNHFDNRTLSVILTQRSSR